MATLLESLAEAVTIRDLSGTLVYANRAAQQQIGFDSVEALQAQLTDVAATLQTASPATTSPRWP